VQTLGKNALVQERDPLRVKEMMLGCPLPETVKDNAKLIVHSIVNRKEFN